MAIASAPDNPPAVAVPVGGTSPLSGLEVSVINPALIDRMSLPLDATGVVVLAADGLALRIGLRAGDVLLELNGREVSSPSDVLFVADQNSRELEMVVLRAGERSRVRFRI